MHLNKVCYIVLDWVLMYVKMS